MCKECHRFNEGEIEKRTIRILRNPLKKLSAIRHGKDPEAEAMRIAQNEFSQKPIDLSKVKIPSQLADYEDAFSQLLRVLAGWDSNKLFAKELKIRLTQTDLFWILVFFSKSPPHSDFRGWIQNWDCWMI